MYEAILQLQTHIRMIWRYRWTALITAGFIALAGWTYVFFMPDQFEVKTKVFLDSRSLLRPVLKGLAVDANVHEDTVLVMRRTLLARPNLETVARSTDMDLSVNTPEEFEQLLLDLSTEVSISGNVKDNIFDIVYHNEDPQLATRVVEALLNIFVERSLGENRKDTSKTKDFLDQQIREYEVRLEAAEQRLKEFKRRNIGLMPEEGKTYFSQRESIRKALAQAQLEHAELKNRRDQIRKSISAEKKKFKANGKSGTEQSGFVSEYQVRIDNMQTRIDDLLLHFTERHPDVVAARRLLEELETKKTVERAEYEKALKENPEVEVESAQLTDDPVYQELKISLGATEAELAAIKARLANYEKRETELKQLVDTIPKVEAELKALNRDYEIDKTNYQELVKRRESLKLSDEAGKTTDDVEFNIIEPPRVPILPSGPDRPKLYIGVLVVAFGAGMGLAWLLSMLRPAFYNKDDVSNFTNLPVLGSVIRISTSGEILRRRIGYVMYSISVSALVMMCIALIIMQGPLMKALVEKIKGLI